MDKWIIHSAAVREDPAAGFDLLAQWLHEEAQTTTRRFERWIDPCLTLVSAAIVLTLTSQVIGWLTQLLRATMGETR